MVLLMATACMAVRPEHDDRFNDEKQLEAFANNVKVLGACGQCTKRQKEACMDYETETKGCKDGKKKDVIVIKECKLIAKKCGDAGTAGKPLVGGQVMCDPDNDMNQPMADCKLTCGGVTSRQVDSDCS
eukprot:TRINITY_DN32783_c0_g1_i1.p1 TRINITY_DN32783_c0_g1~~TRINITY_DN32783_c0_g1_i1.p1  ORF type:complete len:129 (-),score=32.20 TRINITY_DN32783_c0_g1_i1:47-433(-)